MLCERCGNDFMDNTSICPRCGMVRSQARTKQPPTDYGSFLPGTEPSPYQQGYLPPQPGKTPFPHIHSLPPAQPFPPQYPQVPPPTLLGTSVQVLMVNTHKNETALLTEIILSLFGIFGIGWIIGGETTLGVILIVCSIFVYWPIMILGAAFTLGASLICLGPLAISAIILNAVLLHASLKRKAQRVLSSQQLSPFPTHLPPQ